MKQLYSHEGNNFTERHHVLPIPQTASWFIKNSNKDMILVCDTTNNELSSQIEVLLHTNCTVASLIQKPTDQVPHVRQT